MSLYEPSYRKQRNLRALGWQGQLEQAYYPHDVLSVARDFLAQLSPEEITSLPDECRPERLVDEDDVAAYALLLTRAQSKYDASSEPEVLLKLCTFFGDASTRLSQILSQSAND